MKKKEIIDLITSMALLILSFVVLLLPTFEVTDIKLVLTIIFSFYTLVKLTQFIFIFRDKDYESLFTSIISLGAVIGVNLIDFKTQNITLVILIWMGLMCLVKLKKADFYNDRNNKMWVLRLFILFVFLTSGLLTGLNLMYESTVQMIIIGYFFLINSVLDAIDPIAIYLMGVKNEDSK